MSSKFITKLASSLALIAGLAISPCTASAETETVQTPIGDLGMVNGLPSPGTAVGR